MKNSQISSSRHNSRPFALAALLCVAAALLSVCLGAAGLTLPELWQAILSGPDGSAAARILWYVRLPRTAACLLEAREQNLSNFSVLSLLKRTEPALRALIADPDFAVNGFLCPGHVAAITGARAFAFLPQEFRLPAVVSGFEPGDLLYSVWRLADMLRRNEPSLENEYTRVVTEEGNPAALRAMDQVFITAAAVWRGLGEIPDSALVPRAEFAPWDASVKFAFSPSPGAESPGCRCGEVIRGKIRPQDCPLFGRVCTPADPVGPCMVSGEGACAAAYRYRD